MHDQSIVTTAGIVIGLPGRVQQLHACQLLSRVWFHLISSIFS